MQTAAKDLHPPPSGVFCNMNMMCFFHNFAESGSFELIFSVAWQNRMWAHLDDDGRILYVSPSTGSRLVICVASTGYRFVCNLYDFPMCRHILSCIFSHMSVLLSLVCLWEQQSKSTQSHTIWVHTPLAIASAARNACMLELIIEANKPIPPT